MPKAVAMAVNTVMAIFRILPQMLLFSFSISISQILTTFFRFTFALLNGLYRHLLVRESGEDAYEGQSRAEVNAGLLDERCIIVLLGNGTLTADTDLQSTQVAQAVDS